MKLSELQRLKELARKAHPNQGEFPNEKRLTDFIKAANPATVFALADAAMEMGDALRFVAASKRDHVAASIAEQTLANVFSSGEA